MKTAVVYFLIISLMISSIPIVFAEPMVSIYAEKKVYNYGDFLTLTIEVSEITGDIGILRIIDEFGKSSSAIPIPITELRTDLPSPNPFESVVYPEGKYTVEIQYSGTKNSTGFELVDAGNIVIPFKIRELSKYWYNGDSTDEGFAIVIQSLIKEGLIEGAEKNNKVADEIIVPQWFKKPTGWWIDGKISDQEFAESLEYLIKVRIVVV